MKLTPNEHEIYTEVYKRTAADVANFDPEDAHKYAMMALETYREHFSDQPQQPTPRQALIANVAAQIAGNDWSMNGREWEAGSDFGDDKINGYLDSATKIVDGAAER
jgi:hypothetical protein